MKTINTILTKIQNKNKIHANNLKTIITSYDKNFKSTAETYLQHYCDFLMKNFDVNMDFIVDSYLIMVQDYILEQIRFIKKQQYRYSTIQEADENVYSNEEYMFRYMIGMALSQFLWTNHKKMFEFFKKNIKLHQGEAYLEIGCGHGLYFLESIKNNYFKSYETIDISQASLDITEKFISHFFGKIPTNVKFINQDVTTSNTKSFNKFDFITMGEVLEHVENPKSLLNAIYSLLTDTGYVFISTCANCPVKEHIYLYSTIDEIRQQFFDCGFKIQEELVISNDNTKEEEWITKKSNLSYAAILKKDSL